ncbi:sulfotransferase domain-containing protein [Magnetofaba australis]|nr:sulfotransferase domain-containing protein [Magnetofaba australis]
MPASVEETLQTIANMSTEELIEAGKEAQQMGRFEEGVFLAQEALKREPENSDVLTLLGTLAYRAGRKEEAIKVLAHAVELNPGSPDLLYNLGVVLADQDHAEWAKSCFESVLKIDPMFRGANLQLGRYRIERYEVGEAMEHYRRELEINPGQPQTHFELSQILKHFSRFEEADRHLHMALEREPELAQNAAYHGEHPAELAVADEPQNFLIVSYPKCGTHLISDVAQGITGNPFYWPNEESSNLVTEKLLTEMPDGAFPIGHWYPTESLVAALKERNYRVIIQYRDPRDQLVSFYYHYMDEKATKENYIGNIVRLLPKEQALTLLLAGFNGADDAHTSGSTAIMDNWIQQWIESGVPYQIVTFEQMVEHKAESIDRISRFIGYPMDAARRDAIVEKTAFNKPSATMAANKLPSSFKRKGKSGDWVNHLLPEHKTLFKLLAGQLLVRLGYEKGYVW